MVMMLLCRVIYWILNIDIEILGFWNTNKILNSSNLHVLSEV